ncbi:MAG: NAD(P)-dependent glycerol-3-phosphate dehydrogenase [Gemmatimonadota bacterium]|nr:NAD(P)-dependent glycerol-3-phosphate dehydrogenase [Gemmatimonadota bacterium]MDE2873457.1 NAD(P)-dependent glycerol-3-phosphate dehydrogenase [Gemmatimonadota bacterium]
MTAAALDRVAVIGAGAWGTALADLLARSGCEVRLWAREPEVVESFGERGENGLYLEGVPLNRGLAVTNSLGSALEGAEVVLWVCPVQYSAALLAEAAPVIPRGAIVVSASKGIEVATLRRMDEIFAGALAAEQARGLCVLSGPSFAREVAAGMPTAVVVASRDRSARRRIQALFQTDRFRVYTNPDVVGVELGGALKNVIAVAAGVAAGLGLGHNAVAALMTRGLAEMSRLGVALGARHETFAGLAGMGDLVLTCTGGLSRNRTVGVRLGRGETMKEITGEARTVAEGVATVRAVHDLAGRLGVEMPVSAEVYRIVAEGLDPMEALHRLMTREPTSEHPAAPLPGEGS